MLKTFHLGNFGVYTGNFERALSFVEMVLEPPPKDADRDAMLRESIPRFLEAIAGMLDSAPQDVHLSYPVIRQLEKFAELLKAKPQPDDFKELLVHGRIVRQAIMDDLSQHLFFSIGETNRELYEQSEPPFGKAVADKFPDASKDIECACRCVALHEWTASMFHLMRVLEHGLRFMATRFAVPFATDSWHKVLKGIEDEIAALRNKQSQTQKDRDEITFYSDAASQFRHFKDAWRNHVAHARVNYDEKDATKVLAHVREFMQHLTASP